VEVYDAIQLSILVITVPIYQPMDSKKDIVNSRLEEECSDLFQDDCIGDSSTRVAEAGCINNHNIATTAIGKAYNLDFARL